MKLVIENRISRRDAKNLVLDMIRYNDYFHYREKHRVLSDEVIVKSHNEFNRKNGGKSFDKYVEQAMTFYIYENGLFLYNHVEFYENVLDYSKIEFKSHDANSNANKMIINEISNKVGEKISSYGQAVLIPYEGIFLDSFNYLFKAINNSDVEDFVSSINRGIASIENVLRYYALKYNNEIGKEELVDDKYNRVSFNEKIDLWIPKITGKKLDKSSINWQSFNKLKKFRDDNDQHFKGQYIRDYNEIIVLMNLYKYGIAGLLFDILKLFDSHISAPIIRAKYIPKIKIAD